MGENLRLETLLIGGVTNSTFSTDLFQSYFRDCGGVIEPKAVEDPMRPLVAIGCILCL